MVVVVLQFLVWVMVIGFVVSIFLFVWFVVVLLTFTVVIIIRFGVLNMLGMVNVIESWCFDLVLAC